MSDEDKLKFLKQDNETKESSNFIKRRVNAIQDNNLNSFADFGKASSNVLTEKTQTIDIEFARCDFF
jgi:hypothetical protein